MWKSILSSNRTCKPPTKEHALFAKNKESLISNNSCDKRVTEKHTAHQFSQATFSLQNHTSQSEIRADCLTAQWCSRSSNKYKLTQAIHIWLVIWSVNIFKVNSDPSNTFRLHYPFLSPSCCLQTKGIHSVLLGRSKCNRLHMACSGRKQCGVSYHCTDVRPLQAATVTHWLLHLWQYFKPLSSMSSSTEFSHQQPQAKCASASQRGLGHWGQL